MSFRCLPHCVAQRYQAHMVTSCVVRMEGSDLPPRSSLVHRECSSNPRRGPHVNHTCRFWSLPGLNAWGSLLYPPGFVKGSPKLSA